MIHYNLGRTLTSIHDYSRPSTAHRKKLHRDTLCSGMMCFSASGTVALGL